MTDELVAITNLLKFSCFRRLICGGDFVVDRQFFNEGKTEPRAAVALFTVIKWIVCVCMLPLAGFLGGKWMERRVGRAAARRLLDEEMQRRTAAENILCEREGNLRLFIEHAPTAIAMFDQEMLYLAVSRQWLRDYGLKGKQVIGQSHYKIFPEIPERWRAIHRRGLAGEVLKAKEDSFTRLDGTVQWLHWEVRPWRTADGSIGGIVIFTEDISYRKMAQEKLRENEARLSAALQIAQLGIWEYTRITGVFHLDKRCCQIFGFGAECCVSKEQVLALVHPEDRERVEGQVLAASKGKGSYESEFRVLRPEGTLLWVSVRGSAVEFSDESGFRFVGTTMDISERKRSEAEREELLKKIDEQRARLQAIMDSLPVAVWVANLSGKMVMVNDIAAGICGGKAPRVDTIEEYSVYEVYWPNTRERVSVEDYPLSRALRGETVKEMVIDFHRFDGSWGTQTASSAPIRDLEGNILGAVVIALDISRLKQTEEALRQLNEDLEHRVAERTRLAEDRSRQLRKMVAELTLSEQRERKRLAEILHDYMQQLLVGAKINGEILSASVGPEHKLLAENIVNLINQSLKTSRSLTAELSPPVLQQGSLSAAMEWLGRWMLEKHGFEVELKTDPTLDPGQENVTILLFQSVRELLLNVVKHAGVKSARVEMSRNGKDRLHVSVIDQGAGFDPNTVWENANGSRFGLFSIRERIELLGGSMKIESELGKGSVFSLSVPLEISRATSESRIQKLVAKIHDTKKNLEKICILLADDHAVVRDGLSTKLSLESDIEVIGEAADGEEAIKLARELRPDVILMDISMPKMNGLDATRIIHSEFPDIRIIGLSMFDKADQAAAMIAAGAAAYRQKSENTDLLLAAIRGEAE